MVWNVIMGLAIHLNGGFGPFGNRSSLLIAAFGTVGVALISFGAIYSPSVRSIVLRPTASASDVKPGLLFLGFLGSALTIMTFLSMMLMPAAQ